MTLSPVVVGECESTHRRSPVYFRVYYSQRFTREYGNNGGRHMLRNLALSVIAMALASCATATGPVEPPKTISAATGGNTAIIFLRRANVTMASASSANVLLDGKRIGTVSNGQCVRLRIPAGDHTMHLTTGVFGDLGAALGNAIANSLGTQNVKAKRGQRLFYSARPVWDGPGTVPRFTVTQQASGKAC